MLFKILLCIALAAAPALGGALPYIIGGTTVTNAAKHPHQCSLQRYGSHSCGASIISNTWVVTAAHCVGGSTSSYTIGCGGTYWRSVSQKKSVSQIIKHERYGSGAGSFPNDIAVMRLSSGLSFTSTVKAIKMWDSSDPAGNNDCYISGWGVTTTGGGSVSSVLKEAKINVYTNTECKRTWGSSINNGHVCIGVRGSKGSCNGDSGGPLVCRDGSEYKLVGATSWGINGCSPNYPSVYSRISYFRSWIKGKTGI